MLLCIWPLVVRLHNQLGSHRKDRSTRHTCSHQWQKAGSVQSCQTSAKRQSIGESEVQIDQPDPKVGSCLALVLFSPNEPSEILQLQFTATMTAT